MAKVILALCLMVVAVSSQYAGWGGFGGGPVAWGGANVAAPAAPAANPWLPPWVASAPWYPQWSSCTTIGSTCSDCKTKQVCTKIGGITRACADPTMPYCNLGECSATPSAECAAELVPVVPAAAA